MTSYEITAELQDKLSSFYFYTYSLICVFTTSLSQAIRVEFLVLDQTPKMLKSFPDADIKFNSVQYMILDGVIVLLLKFLIAENTNTCPSEF